MNAEICQLRPGYQILRVIKGGWQLAGGHGWVDRTQAIADMSTFYDAGIRTFDCADIYTGVEEMIGDFIETLRRDRGSESAEKVTVHTKLVPDRDSLSIFGSKDIERIIDRSLKRLRLDQLHLVQFYWWDLSIGRPYETLECLKKLCEKGKIRHLGINNWDVKQTATFVDKEFDIVSTQVQYSLLDRRPSNGLARWCAENDINLLCYGSLAGGFITEYWLEKPDPGFIFENRSLIKYRLIIDEFGGWDLFQTLLKTVKVIADKHLVSMTAVAVRYVLDQPQVGAVIIGARYAHHLSQTLSIFELSLDPDDYAILEEVIDQSHGPSGYVYELESYSTGRHGRIMEYNLNALKYSEDKDNLNTKSENL